MDASGEPLELGRSVSATDHHGNLALCRLDRGGIECLGKTNDVPMTFRTGNGIDDDAQYNNGEPPDPKLNWKYDKGLLRSVDPDGVETNRCLGPNGRVKVLDGTTGQPYELILQDCPHIPGRKENIFVRSKAEATSSSTAESSIDSATGPVGTTPAPPYKSYARHMQYLVQGDGRVQSLAPVFDDLKEPGDDLVAEKPFCITVMKWGDDEEEKAYLVPCHRDGESIQESFHNQETIDLMKQVQPEQQVFDTERGSVFASFLLDLNSKDTNYLQLAYQIGFSSDSSPSLSDKSNYEDFESIAIKVMTEDTNNDGVSSLVTERIISSVWANNERQSGIVSYEISGFSRTGRMEAHLIGRSMGGLETTWLASTTFEVPTRRDIFPNGWTWSLVVFTGIMACYLILVKANNMFCPTGGQRKRTRNSELTAATANSNNNVSDMDWGIVPTLDVLLPNRISEAEEEREGSGRSRRSSSFNNAGSVYDMHDMTASSVYDTTATDMTDDRDSTLESNENDVEDQENPLSR